MTWGMRRRKLSAEEIAANKAKRDAREAASMTCQICARQILANTGVIAHHGYTRPGWGSQSASCYGARELPYQASCEALKRCVVMVEGWLRDRRESIVKHKAESIPVVEFVTWETREKGAGWNAPKTKHYHTFKFMRAEFAAYRADPANAAAFSLAFGRNREAWTFDQWKAATIADLEREASGYESDLVQMRKRVAAWKLTHAYDPDAQAWGRIKAKA